MLKKKQKILTAILDAFILLSPLLLKAIAPLIFRLPLGCPTYKLGYLCPACGGTRCVYAFFGGNFSDAFLYNPFIFISIFYFFALIILLNLRVFFNTGFAKPALKLLVSPKAVIIWAILFAIFGILRNFI